MAVSDQDLEEALSIAAKMIDLYGYKYWPIFERLEAELEARSDRIKRVQARLPVRRSSKCSNRELGA
ncbi:MAG: hypothetical protein VR74_14080 [Hyphomonas sp. BRH_c22]|uniref:hypothetical protein n=1 Tax=Hyphomonas sp. BRH_c22 TaxID=1629710 RepID=UPI0005F0EC44|nr:hypothetical protein [Hyphomonas sp. BRH_c22]KJS36104.1 MAG: hypothetical protein VR74_14080 [Hyphomonas sp. BRH_c22]